MPRKLINGENGGKKEKENENNKTNASKNQD